ncbi:MAG: DUF1648 domain-containing protein [Ancrocorticia sp.]
MLKRFIVVGLVAPVLLWGVSTALQMIWIPRLPDPIATHWGASGEPDGYGTMWTPFIGTLVCALILPCSMVLYALKGVVRGDVGPTYRFIAAASCGMSGFFAVLFAWTTGMQADIPSWEDSPSVMPGMAVALGFAVVVGVGGWFIQPAVRVPAARYRKIEPIALRRDERVSWTATAAMNGFLVALLALVVMGSTILSAMAWIVWDTATAGFLTVSTIITGLILVTMTVFRVRIDKEGLLIQSAAGLPRVRVPLDQIAEIRVTDVNPVGQFGGWGVRGSRNRLGIITRTGEALAVKQTNGRLIIITVDGAESAAVLLDALVWREQEKRTGGWH